MTADPEDTINFISTVQVEQFQSAWDRLTEKSRFVLAQRHYGQTLEAVGRELEVTRERVRQIQVGANRKFISRIRRSRTDWSEWAVATNTEFSVMNLQDLSKGFRDANVSMVFLPIILESLGWKPQKKRSEWWVQDFANTMKIVNRLWFKEPIKNSEWNIHLYETGLPVRYVQYLIEENLLPLERFQDYMIQSQRRRRDQAHVYLLEHGPSHVRQIADALGEEVARNLDAFMSRQDVFTKVFPGGEWALAEFTDVKYKKAIDAILDLLSDHGPLAQKDLYRYMSDIFPVTIGRIQQCLTDFRIGKMPDGRIWLVEHGAEKEKEPEPERPSHMHCAGKIVGIRRDVDSAVIRGSGLMDNKWLAWRLGLHSTPMKRTFTGIKGLPELSVTRAGVNSQISAIREAVNRSGLFLGCSIVILLNLENTTWDLKHACSRAECIASNGQQRLV